MSQYNTVCDTHSKPENRCNGKYEESSFKYRSYYQCCKNNKRVIQEYNRTVKHEAYASGKSLCRKPPQSFNYQVKSQRPDCCIDKTVLIELTLVHIFHFMYCFLNLPVKFFKFIEFFHSDRSLSCTISNFQLELQHRIYLVRKSCKFLQIKCFRPS